MTKRNIKSFRHNMTKDYLKRSLKVSAAERLNWLQDMAEFTKKFMPKNIQKYLDRQRKETH